MKGSLLGVLALTGVLAVGSGAVAARAQQADSTHVAYWDSATSNPITDIRHAKTQARLNSGGFVPRRDDVQVRARVERRELLCRLKAVERHP